MTTNPPIRTARRGLHPMLWIAAGAVTIFAVTGTAYITGLLPHNETAPATTAAPAPTPTTQAPAGPPVAPVANANTATPATPAPPIAQAPAPAPVKPKVAASRHHSAAAARQEARGESPATRSKGTRVEAAAPVICPDCGVVESTRTVAKEGEGSGLGAVAGGVVGGVLGNGVGQGTGRDLATIAGAIGGAVLGNKIEKNQRQTVSYHTTVRFEDGTSRIFITDHPSPWQPGDKVKVVDGRLTPR